MRRREMENTMSHTSDIHSVELARKAVGKILVDNVDPNEEEGDDAISVFVEDEMPIRPVKKRVREQGPLPEPQPAVKVNSASVAVNRVAAGRKRDADEGDSRPRPVQSRHVFLNDEEEEDEFTSFRQRYKPRDRIRERSPDVREPTPYHTHKEDISELTRPAYKQGRRTSRGRANGRAEPAYVDAMPGIIRGAAVGLAVLFLLIMVFLVYNNNILSGQLQELSDRQEAFVTVQHYLNYYRLRVESLENDLDFANGQIDVLRGNAPIPPNVPSNGHGSSYVGTYPPLPPEQVMHTVASGENLTAIARRHYGYGSHANIMKIANANNLSYPFYIHVGDQLIIPPA
jgi:nucleoid-associated protein YgaU